MTARLPGHGTPTAAAVMAAIDRATARLLGPYVAYSRHAPFAVVGLDLAQRVALTLDVEEALGLRFGPPLTATLEAAPTPAAMADAITATLWPAPAPAPARPHQEQPA